MEAIATLSIPGIFVLFVVLERLFPARRLPPVRRWLAKGFLFFFISGGLNAVVPALLGPALGAHSLVHLAGLGTLGGALAAFGVLQLCVYFTHRTMHTVPLIWRWTHQLHHSAERLDMAGAVYFHPFDITVQAATATLAVALLGVTADAGALAGLLGFFYGMFQHLNVRTPAWLGYLIQRPESHSVHHQRGVHAYNYADLPIYDLLFGTFRNPAEFAAEAGFWDGASAEVLPMLLGRDVGAPATQGASPPLGAEPLAG